MTLTINGAPQPLEPGETVRTLLGKRNLSPDKVAVELNRRLLRSEGYDEPLKDGDVLEIVTFVGGG